MKQNQSDESNTPLTLKCSSCGYTLRKAAPPDVCPSCNQRCEFADVSCYTPECGFSGADDRLS